MKKVFYSSLLLLTNLTLLAQAPKKIKFKAVIENRKSDTLIIRGENAFNQIIPINSSKQFEATFAAPKGFYQFFDGQSASTMYLKPETDIVLMFDADRFDKSITYSGKGSDESNFLAKFGIREEVFTEEAFAKEPDEFQRLFEIKRIQDRESIENGNYDPEFKTIILSSFTNNDRYILQAYQSVSKERKLIGKASPEFTYENHKGGTTQLTDLKGKYVYIDIWATWCAPCRQEIPYLQKIEKKYDGKKITFVSISIDQKKDYEKWKSFVSEKNLGGIQLLADNDWNSDFILKYEVRGIPRFILLDPNGNIVSADAQRPSDPKLQDKLDVLLQEANK